MKINDLRKKTIKELKEELVLAYQEYFNLRFKKRLNDSKMATCTHKIGHVRHLIARIKTILGEKKIHEYNKK